MNKGGLRHPANPQHTPSTSAFDPLNLIRSMLRRWHIILLMMIAGGLGAYLYLQHTIPVYMAKAELEMSVRRPKVINSEAFFEDSSGMRDTDMIFNTRFAKFKSPAMEELATEEYFKRYPDDTSISREDLAWFIREVAWSKDSGANIVRVACYNTDPEFAPRLVNLLADCAGILMMKENQAISDEAVKWLITQVDEKRNELERVEQKLVEIRKDTQLGSLQQRKNALDQVLISVLAEREQLISTLTTRKTVYDFVLELKEKDSNLELLPAGLPKEERLNELMQTWRTAYEELQLVSGRFTEIHPEYKTAADRELRARGRLEQFIDMSAKSVVNEIDLLTKQIEQVDERINAMKSESLELDLNIASGMQRLQSRERERDAADNAYQTMLRRMEEARLSADEDMAYTKMLRSATVPRVPISPVKSKVLTGGVVIGAVLAGLIIILMELCMDHVALVGDLKALGLNVLATIPSQKKIGSRGELATIGLRDKFSHIVEIFAGVNAMLTSSKYIGRTKVMLFSSILPGEGKTICACNMAISAALNGSRTLLIDADLRRPQLVNIFAIPEEHPSLLEWLSCRDNSMGHHELVLNNVIENLDVITSRPMKEINPAELLGRGRLEELLNWARGRYDRVIIDSPPLGPVGDAMVIANHVDSVVLVSRIGKTRKRGLRFALSRFDEAGVQVIGCIANDVSHSLAGMFSGGDGYGYSYGYGGYKPYVSE